MLETSTIPAEQEYKPWEDLTIPFEERFRLFNEANPQVPLETAEDTERLIPN